MIIRVASTTSTSETMTNTAGLPANAKEGYELTISL